MVVRNRFNLPRVGPSVRLGAFSVVDTSPDEAEVDDDRVLELLALAEAADAAGLHSLWVAEHHFRGTGACPSPPVLLAACGMRAPRLRLGSLVSVLPFHRPVDVAEEYALLDRLLGGRLNLGVGSGYLPSEFEGFGVDPAEKRARFDEALAVVLDAFAGRPIRPGGGAAPAVALNVRPVQRPHPPIWVAVQRREAVVHVARRGLGLALIPYATVDAPAELRGVIDDYRAALPAGVPGNVAAAVHLYVGEQVDLARAAFRRYVAARLATGSTFLVKKAHDRPEHASPETIERSGLAVFTVPEELEPRLRPFAEAGVDELLGIFDFGRLPSAEVARSVRAAGAAWARASALSGARERGRPAGPEPEVAPPERN